MDDGTGAAGILECHGVDLTISGHLLPIVTRHQTLARTSGLRSSTSQHRIDQPYLAVQQLGGGS